VLRTVTTPIKNFLSRAKTSLLSFLSSHSPCSTTVHVVKLQPPVSTSGCMTINCPPLHSAIPVNPSCAYGPHDCLNERTDSTMYSASLQNPCPDLDPSSSTDSLQTHDSLTTPESPPYLPSPIGSLEEGSMNDSAKMAPDTQVQAHDPATPDTTHVAEVTQVRTDDSLTYDSLVTALSRLSLEPQPNPLSDLHHNSTSPPP